MTVSSVTNKTTGTAGTGAVGQVISFNVPVFAASEITMVARDNAAGTDTTLVQDTDYSVTLVGTGTPNYTSATLTMLVATYDSDYTLYAYRVTTQTQALDLIENDDFGAQTMEQQIDKLFCLIADLKEEVGRCIKVPIGDGTITTEVDDSVARASDYLKFDSSGNVTVSAT